MTDSRRRRVVVALHPADEADDALACAAALALELEGELLGLFLEDQMLFDLCGLEAVEVSGSTGAARRLDAEMLERQLRATAGAARSRVSQAAAERRVAWSFEVRRGRAGVSVLQATETAALVVASRSSIGAPGFLRARRRAGPVAALLDGGPGEEATLRAAAQAARRLGAPLVGLVVGERPRERSRGWAELAGGIGVALELRVLPDEPETIAATLAELSPRLLAMDARAVASGGPELTRYLAAAGADAMFVGPA